MKYLQLVKAIDATSQQLLGRAAAAVNQALVLRNWLIGAYIVEFEQNGEDRAKYSARLLVSLRADLLARGLGGLSISTLERMRRLYQCYPQLAAQIPSTLLTESGTRLDFKVLSIPSTVLTESPPASRRPAIRGTLPPESITPLSPQCDALAAQLRQIRTRGAHLLDSTLHDLIAA